MFIVGWMKGSPGNGSYFSGSGSNLYSTLDDAKKHVEATIAQGKFTNYDVVILDMDQHTVASWAAALPPALQWNAATVADHTKVAK
jgi:hypothetical protein